MTGLSVKVECLRPYFKLQHVGRLWVESDYYPGYARAMKRWLMLAAFVALTLGLAGAEGLHYQMSKAEVKAAAGEPLSSLERSGRAIWMYPDGGRVEFEDGRIVSIQNMLMADEAERLAAAKAAAQQAQAELEAEQAAAEEERLKFEAELAEAEAEFAAANAEMMEQFSESIENYEAMLESGQMPIDLGLGPPDPLQYWLSLGVEAIVGVILTLVILKAAFKWCDLHADWGQLVMPAMVDMFAGVLVRGGAYLLLQTDQLYRIDDGVSFFALIAALRWGTHAGTLQRAVSVAVVCKLANIVVWSLLSVVVLQVLFG